MLSNTARCSTRAMCNASFAPQHVAHRPGPRLSADSAMAPAGKSVLRLVTSSGTPARLWKRGYTRHAAADLERAWPRRAGAHRHGPAQRLQHQIRRPSVAGGRLARLSLVAWSREHRAVLGEPAVVVADGCHPGHCANIMDCASPDVRRLRHPRRSSAAEILDQTFGNRDDSARRAGVATRRTVEISRASPTLWRCRRLNDGISVVQCTLMNVDDVARRCVRSRCERAAEISAAPRRTSWPASGRAATMKTAQPRRGR